jgi:hypothetical protein
MAMVATVVSRNAEERTQVSSTISSSQSVWRAKGSRLGALYSSASTTSRQDITNHNFIFTIDVGCHGQLYKWQSFNNLFLLFKLLLPASFTEDLWSPFFSLLLGSGAVLENCLILTSQ